MNFECCHFLFHQKHHLHKINQLSYYYSLYHHIENLIFVIKSELLTSGNDIGNIKLIDWYKFKFSNSKLTAFDLLNLFFF